ncbi:hypothetical protein P170DRAFT_437516 [Aspergillus steynii IBT 23096]|uniref:Uncharacterized protein n=1 Tax=Aspergillus steynii IBT 23096 TaxID=1392250 RepID=A0A2I2G4J0_9EURO|nr:uncharacterized protein P170DRAFT_437516 [Aspergillus steynii IBT 23096]PLB47779.1 hypothetical protein P170DRAFT_437516 [Aspergillus steynii IBT 23096]
MKSQDRPPLYEPLQERDISLSDLEAGQAPTTQHSTSTTNANSPAPQATEPTPGAVQQSNQSSSAHEELGVFGCVMGTCGLVLLLGGFVLIGGTLIWAILAVFQLIAHVGDQ